MDNNDLKNIARTIRGLAIDGVEAANSGHPGMPMGMADVAAVLWTEFLKFNPENPHWFDRDRFVLSAGHGSMLLYSLLHLYGYDLPLDELRNFRQWGSKTPGHPEYHDTPGVETTTGPLGQGISNAVGMALAEKSLAARFNKKDMPVVDHYTYVIASDGDLEEGISHESCSFAGHNCLSKLIVLYDDNSITIDGETHLSFSEDVIKRFEAYGWHAQGIDGHDYDAIREALKHARDTDKPSIIACRTLIGYGSPNKSGTAEVHGSPLGTEEALRAKEQLGIPAEPLFYIPDDVLRLTRDTGLAGREREKSWNALREAYRAAHPEDAQKFGRCLSKEVPDEAMHIPHFEQGKMATRSASGKILDHLAPRIPALIGGSADLTPSNKTLPKSETAFSTDNPEGRYLHFGVREHAMGAMLSGMALHGGVIPYGGTFFIFTDYMRPAMRLAALMGVQVVYVLTHDSIGLGEDGPTHQPIEHMTAFRAMPNMSLIRPMDANETAVAWMMALKRTQGPTGLILTRQNLPIYDRKKEGMASAEEATRGGYVLIEDDDFSIILIASGSEVQIAINARKVLNAENIGVRVVSMPSTDVFDAQPEDYREEVLPASCSARVAIEAGATLSWYKYVGFNGSIAGIDRFGASAPYQTIYDKLGLTPDRVARQAKALLVQQMA